MLPCGHKYHSMCFASTLVSKQVCVQLGCNERITEIVKSMLVGHNPRASPYLQDPTMSDVKTEVSRITNKLAYVELLTVVSYSFHHFAGWSDAEAAHNISFGGVEEENVFDLGIASPGGAEKSSSDHKDKKPVTELDVIHIEVKDDSGEKQFGSDTAPLNQLYLVQHLRWA